MDAILQQAYEGSAHALNKNLTYRDLLAFGISAIIGAGIFSTVGQAAAHGGPGISLLFLFTAMACVFSALCYAQFASQIPISGSAYTYAYHAFGELVAWIIGWDLLMEYAISNVVVAISWSDYFTSFLEGFGISLPSYLTMDFQTAARHGSMALAPHFYGIPLVFDLPALAINVGVTWLVYIGIYESKMASNIMVILKLVVIGIVVVVGIFYVKPSHWVPFLPLGWSGVLSGVSAVFFAYIGFDAISTTAEECINPQKDLPKAMISSLLVCAVIYVIIALVLTGMVPYHELNVGDPMAYVFQVHGLDFLSGLVSASAVIAMTGVILVYQLAQPRIWLSMSRDGLLPKAFSRIHPRFKTPSFATIIMGISVGLPVLFMNLQEVTDLSSIGTLFAFVLICGGTITLKPTPQDGVTKKFRMPQWSGTYSVPLLFGTFLIWGMVAIPDRFRLPFPMDANAVHTLPFLFFICTGLVISLLTFLKNWPFIPVMGVLVNLYLMSELGWTNWARFLIWLVVGLVIYVGFGFRNSKLKKEVQNHV